MAKKLILVFFLFVCVGCAEYMRVSREATPEDVDISGQSIGILFPNEGSYRNVVSNGSGKILIAKIVAYLNKRRAIVTVIDDIEGAFESCHGKGVEYLIVPYIMQWEDSGFNLSGHRDRVEIKLEMYETGTAKRRSYVVFRSMSPWWTFAGKKTEDLLDENFEKAVVKLFVIEREG